MNFTSRARYISAAYNPSLLRRPQLSLLNILSFLIPSLSFVEFTILGRLFLTEILLVGILPFLFFSNPTPLTDHRPKLFIILGITWLFGLIFTDIVRNTPPDDYLRGWAKITVSLLNFCSIYLLLIYNRTRIILFTIGIIVGSLILFLVFPSDLSQKDPWKFGLAFPISFFLIYAATMFSPTIRLYRLITYGILVLATALNFYLDFRSMGGICALTLVYFFIFGPTNRKRPSKHTPFRVLLIFFVLVASSFLLVKAYEFTAQSGLLGELSKKKADDQSVGRLGLIIGGRSEILVSTQAILDSPIIGHGSWAKDTTYVTQLLNIQSALGYNPGGPTESELIPTHSHLFGAWVEAGILGAVFWFWILSLPLRTLAQLTRTSCKLLPLVAFISFLLIWDIIFSPFGAERRFLMPFYVVVMMSFLPPISHLTRYSRSPLHRHQSEAIE